MQQSLSISTLVLNINSSFDGLSSNFIWLEDLIEPMLNINILSILAIFMCTLAVTTLNTIVSVLYLIVLYVIIAYFLITIGIVFIGISYIIIYIGAIAILFLFILMILDIELISNNINKNNNMVPLILLLGSLLFSSLYLIKPTTNNYLEIYFNIFYNYIIYSLFLIGDFSIFHRNNPLNNYFDDFIKDFNHLKLNNSEFNKDYLNPIFNNFWDMNVSNNPQVNSLGFALYSNYWIWLILLCLILVLGIISVITLTIPKTNNNLN